MLKEKLFSFDDNVEEDIYTSKIEIPQYCPSKEKPKVYNIYDLRKYKDLVYEINNSNITEDEKEFLKFAATRHIVFNYAKIADYYAHSNKEMQELMEKSALVIVDINDAIANGYVKLSNRLQKMIEEAKNAK